MARIKWISLAENSREELNANIDLLVGEIQQTVESLQQLNRPAPVSHTPEVDAQSNEATPKLAQTQDFNRSVSLPFRNESEDFWVKYFGEKDSVSWPE